MKVILAILFVLVANPLLACEAIPLGLYDKWIRIKADGSFQHAGEGRWGIGDGAAIVDIGGGRVGQKLSFGASGCSVGETLLFVDCTKGEAIFLHGKPSPDLQIAGAFYTYISQIQKPIGPIGLTASITVDDLVSIATKNDIGYNTNVDEIVASMRIRNRYNPYNGCKLFYPDSVGAKL